MTASETPHHAGIGMLQQFPHVPVEDCILKPVFYMEISQMDEIL